VFAWPDLPEALSQTVRELVYEKARSIIEIALRSFRSLTGIHSALYMLHPAKDPAFCPNPGTMEKLFRGSCVGFVDHCLEFAWKQQVVDSSRIPLISAMRDLSGFAAGRYFLSLDRMAKERDDKHSLLEGDFPLRLLFPGYQLAAIKSGQYPYAPTLSDATFHE
jgi:hypothetical protein